jgi:hypothetical protein
MDAGGGVPWLDHAADLIQWFAQRRAELPTTPFQLNAWTRVLDPATFYAALSLDIAQGPQSPRAAVLIGELEELFAWRAQK